MIKRLTPFLAILVVLLAAVALGAASPRTADAQPSANLFSDNMENGVNGWTTSVEATGNATCVSEWHQVTGDSKSPTHSWTNSPYTAAGTGECLNHLVSPSFATPLGDPSIFLSFWEHHFTEGGALCNPPTNTPPCDFGQVYISKNGGAFTLAHAMDVRFEGGAPGAPYTRVVFPLEGLFTPGDSIQIRFTFSSDALLAVLMGGWWIDDVSVDTELSPTAATLTSFTAAASRAGVTLRWRTASELDVLGFDVWRFGAGKAVKVNRALVPAKAGASGASYRLVDRTARAGASYTYRLRAVGRDGSRVWRASTRIGRSR